MGVRSKLLATFCSEENRLDVFYILAFAPLLLVTYYNIRYLSLIMFGFLLLLLKRHKLSACREAVHTPRALAIILLLVNLGIYYALFQLFPFAAFYGVAANYIAYIFGLYLVFFELSALRHIFTPTFIIVAATSVSSISTWLELNLSSYIIPNFVTLVSTIMNALGVNVTTQYPNKITLHTWRGPIPLFIIWGCIGAYGALVFSLIMVIVFSEEPVSLKTKTLWAVIGIIGILVLNIIRVVIVLVVAYYYTFDLAEFLIHPYLGYALFFTWLALFLYTFSKRQVILENLLSVRQKLRL
jgi:exosortase/archaeosortase family protein